MGRTCGMHGTDALPTRLWLDNLKGRDPLENLCIGWKTILDRILEKQGGEMWTGFI
jgi:hypothetical protein